ncbi:decaprenyl-phosphate phosphoribosyltransferase [Sinosporangium siamense]|nr:decaprenyl-phosphate phosphoribosyltransferase [Sinosporangium siamense]
MKTAERSSRTARRSRTLALLIACRPRQWLKNTLVFAAPLASGTLLSTRSLTHAAIAFAAFCLAASGTYLLNDAADLERDRRHPRKRHRPLASGAVPVGVARTLAVVLIVAAPAVAALTGAWRLPAVVAAYLALTLAYTVWLKHQVVVDLVAVAGCHVIRAFAGAVAIDVVASSWFLVVISLGALQLVAGKRESELRDQGVCGTRETLAAYPLAYLGHVRAMCSGAMIVTYCLWALQVHPEGGPFWYGVSIVPLVLIVLRHNLLVERGEAEEPEELALRDRPMQIFVGLLVILLLIAVYAT